MNEPIPSFTGLNAVVTGGGTGMGRELTRQLAAEGCSVAICDVSQQAMDETVQLARWSRSAMCSSAAGSTRPARPTRTSAT